MVVHLFLFCELRFLKIARTKNTIARITFTTAKSKTAITSTTFTKRKCKVANAKTTFTKTRCKVAKTKTTFAKGRCKVANARITFTKGRSETNSWRCVVVCGFLFVCSMLSFGTHRTTEWMENFRRLNQDEYNIVWERFYNLFQFSPSISKFPAVRTDRAQLKFDIANCFSEDFPDNRLKEYAIKLFISVSRTGDRFYALDWQHECYDFDPRKLMQERNTNEWPIPVLPDGDYHIFLTKDFNNVWFGHPWEQTITFIGEDIVKQGQKMNSDFQSLGMLSKPISN